MQVTIHGYDDAYTTGVIDVFTLSSQSTPPSSSSFTGGGGGGGGNRTIGVWAPAPYNLSVPRESTASVAFQSGGIVVAGGWKKADGKYVGDNTVDAYGNAATGKPAWPSTLKSDAYDVGAAVVGGSTAIVIGNDALYTYAFLSFRRMPCDFCCQ